MPTVRSSSSRQLLFAAWLLQRQDGVTSIRAEQVHGMRGVDIDFDAHDFY